MARFRSAPRPAAAQASRDPLAAIPAAAEGVEAKTDSAGRVQLLRPLPAQPGLMGRLNRVLGFRRDIRVNLDERGSCFWSLIDGQRDLRAIADELGRRFALNTAASQRATLEFTRSLMLRHLLNLILPGAPAPGRKER